MQKLQKEVDRLEGKFFSPFVFNVLFLSESNQATHSWFICLHNLLFDPWVFPDELRAEQERNKMLQEDMEATLQDIQNM